MTQPAWIELSFDTTREAIDWIRTLLATVDYTDTLSITKSSNPNWAFSVCFYVPYDASTHANINRIVQTLTPLHRTGLTTELETSIVSSKPSNPDAVLHRVASRFVVLAPDSEYSAQPHEIPIKLNPSLAFGSGLHPATQLSLTLLDRFIKPSMQTLDLGSGSGILSVAMAKLGATVLAIDNDAIAAQATQNAVDLNAVNDQVRVLKASLGQGSQLGHWINGTLQTVQSVNAPEQFDLVMSNILARVHIALAWDVRRSLRPNGLLIAAGFTTDYEPEVTTALIDVGFKAIDSERLDEWVALTYQLR